MTRLYDDWTQVRARMARACKRAGRPPQAARLIAVSKTFPAERIAELAAAGQDDFGESYLQEALPKIEAAQRLAGRALCWHFIGPIQSNKTAAVARSFAWAHGVDRLRIAQRLSDQRPPGLPPLDVCVQVNVSGEASKSGCTVEDTPALCVAISELPRLRLRGLMCLPAPQEAPEAVRPAFRRTRELFERVRAGGAIDAGRFDTLSMGMSQDFEVAIEEGATLVRVGTAIFGRRS
jgi:pyridoxal phosphate enzyme (YggS family)